MARKFENMPDRIMGHSIKYKVIPTVCNLKNMLTKLQAVNGDFSQLKQWEKRSYKAYNIEAIKSSVLKSDEDNWPDLIRNHILNGEKVMFGASCIDIYLVAYVANEYGHGKDIFTEFIYSNEISNKPNTVNAIWTVGKVDGIYLDLLNQDGSIKDYDFFEKWISR